MKSFHGCGPTTKKTSSKTLPMFRLGKNETLCYLTGFQVTCKTISTERNVSALPLFADYFVDSEGEKRYRQLSQTSRPIATEWFRPQKDRYCGQNSKAPCANLGDELGPLLLLKLSGKKYIEKRYDGMDVLVIGSILNFVVSNYNATVRRIGSHHNVTVWGSGTK